MILLGIDCGTQSTKTVALDGGTGKLIASAAKHYDVLPGCPRPHGAKSLHMDRGGRRNHRKVLEQLAPVAGEVRGIGISGQQHGFVPLDREGQVIRPAKFGAILRRWRNAS